MKAIKIEKTDGKSKKQILKEVDEQLKADGCPDSIRKDIIDQLDKDLDLEDTPKTNIEAIKDRLKNSKTSWLKSIFTVHKLSDVVAEFILLTSQTFSNFVGQLNKTEREISKLEKRIQQIENNYRRTIRREAIADLHDQEDGWNPAEEDSNNDDEPTQH